MIVSMTQTAGPDALEYLLRHISPSAVEPAPHGFLPAEDLAEAEQPEAAQQHDLRQLTAHFGRLHSGLHSGNVRRDTSLHREPQVLLTAIGAPDPDPVTCNAYAYWTRCDSDDLERFSLAIGYALNRATGTWQPHAWCTSNHSEHPEPGEEKRVWECSEAQFAAYFGFILIRGHSDDDFGRHFLSARTDWMSRPPLTVQPLA